MNNTIIITDLEQEDEEYQITYDFNNFTTPRQEDNNNLSYNPLNTTQQQPYNNNDIVSTSLSKNVFPTTSESYFHKKKKRKKRKHKEIEEGHSTPSLLLNKIDNTILSNCGEWRGGSATERSNRKLLHPFHSPQPPPPQQQPVDVEHLPHLFKSYNSMIKINSTTPTISSRNSDNSDILQEAKRTLFQLQQK